jgi:glucose-1-phosphate thymidylyltransferase
MIDHGENIKTVHLEGWYDCGKVETLLETNKILLDKGHHVDSKTKNSVIIKPVFIDKDVMIENSIIGPNVSLASGSKVSNSIIQDSIIDNCAVLDSIKIKDSIIGENAVVNGTFKKINLGDYSELHLN